MRGNRTEDKYSLSPNQGIDEDGKNSTEIEGYGENIVTSDILEVERTTKVGILIPSSSEASRNSEKISEGISAITASSLLTISNFDEVNKIGDEKTRKLETTVSQFSKASTNHMSRISLERGLEIPASSTLIPQSSKASWPNTPATISTELNTSQNWSGKSTIKAAEAKRTTRVMEKQTSVKTPSNVGEQTRTAGHVKQMHLTDEKIDDFSSKLNQAIVTEALISSSITESKKEGIQNSQPGNTSATSPEANVLEVTSKRMVTVAPEFDSTVSTGDIDSKFESLAVLYKTSTPSGERSHKVTLDFGLEIARAALTTGSEIIEASSEHTSGTGESVDAMHSKVTIEPVQFMETTVKFESEQSESEKSEFKHTSLPVKISRTKSAAIILENFPGRPTEVFESTDVSLISEEEIRNIKGSDTASLTSVTVVGPKMSLPPSTQISAAPPETVSVSFNESVSHDESSETLATKYSLITVNVMQADSRAGSLRPPFTTGTVRLDTSPTKQATTANPSVKLTDGDAAEEVIAVTGEIRPFSGHGKSATFKTKNDEVPPTKEGEVKGSEEEIIELQTASSANGFVSNAKLESGATDDKAHEVGLEIVPKRADSIINKTDASLQKKWTRIGISPKSTSNASLSFTHSRENYSTGKTSEFVSHGTEESISSGTISSEKVNGVLSVNTSRKATFALAVFAGKKQNLTQDGKVFINKETSPITNVSSSKIILSSLLAAKDIAKLSRPFPTGSTKEKSSEASHTTNKTLLSAGTEVRQRNALKPAGHDETTILNADGVQARAVTTPQSNESSVVFSNAKASGTGIEFISSTIQDIPKITASIGRTGKDAVTADEENKHFSNSTVDDLNNSSKSVTATITETATWKPDIRGIEGSINSTFSEAPSGKIRSETAILGTPPFREDEVPGAVEVIKVFSKLQEWTSTDTGVTALSGEFVTTNAANKKIAVEQIERTPMDNGTSKSISESLASPAAKIEQSGSSTILETTSLGNSFTPEPESAGDTVYGLNGAISTTRASSPKVFPQSKKMEMPRNLPSSSNLIKTVGQKTSGIELDKTTDEKRIERTESKPPETGITKIVTDENLESVENRSFWSTHSESESTTTRVNTLDTVLASLEQREPASAQEKASSRFKNIMQTTASVAYRTSTNTFSSTPIVANYASAVTDIHSDNSLSSLAVSETENAVSEFKQFKKSNSRVTPAIITSTSAVFETYSEDSVTEATSPERNIVLQHFGSSKTDLLPIGTLPMSNLEITSTVSGINLLKTEPETSALTIKPEEAGESNVLEMKAVPDQMSQTGAPQPTIQPSGISTRIEQASTESSVNDGDLFKLNQKVRLQLFFASFISNLKQGVNKKSLASCLF